MSQIIWVPQSSPGAPLGALNPFSPLVMWWNHRIMDGYISTVLNERFNDRKERSKEKFVIDLALESQSPRKENSTKAQTNNQLDSTFSKKAVVHLKTFLFAGHDTVSGTICYAYHCLSKDPSRLAKVREEHDQIFGSNLDDAPELIRAQPSLLSKLPYTLAVIKEVLRLYPPASTVRAGGKE